MAQEKQRPPLSKAANGENGQQKKKAGAISQKAGPLGGAPELGSHQKGGPRGNPINTQNLSNSGKPGPIPGAGNSAGQPGGPNVKPVNILKQSESEPYPTRTSAKQQAQTSRDEDDGDQHMHDRRRAAPARRRFAANDDVPSIGGLIFALQQRPSNRPFVIAGIASAVWVALSFGIIWSVLWPVLNELKTVTDLFQSTSAMSTIAIVTIPIALFWFLALLIWRAQELRLMSSAMTEVAVRLAEPDKAAEQSVASLGQSVRRQVTAMNDAISRALGRAGELEAMVHNEVAALERSYSENEHRIRKLIGDLAHERTALTSDSERISSALSGLGQRVTKQIEHQGITTTQLLEKTSGSVSSKLLESSEKVAQSMSEQSNAVVSTMTTMNDRVGREMPALLDRMSKEQIKLGKVVEHASKNLTALDSSIGHHAGALNNALTDRTQQLEGIFRKHVQTMSISMEERSQILDNALGNKLQTFDNTLISRMDDFEDTLTDTTQKIDTALSNKAQYLDMAISSRVAELDSALVQRTMVIDAAFTERLQALDNALRTNSQKLDQEFAHRAEELGRNMDARSQYIVQTIGAKTKELDNALMSGAKTLQLTTEDVGKKVMSTIHGLAGQANVLKEVSAGMQNHVSQITHNLREQSNFVVQAAAQLENSHDRIGSKLGTSQVNLQNLVEAISLRTSDLDQVMGSYSKQLENTLSQAEHKAHEITQSLRTRSASQSMEALSELTRLRDVATSQTEQAIIDMKDRIAAVSNEMSTQISSLSSEINDTQSHLKEQLQHIPDSTRKSATLMRKTLQDQLKALESLSSISNGSSLADVSTPHSDRGSRADLAAFQSSLGNGPGAQAIGNTANHDPFKLGAQGNNNPARSNEGNQFGFGASDADQSAHNFAKREAQGFQGNIAQGQGNNLPAQNQFGQSGQGFGFDQGKSQSNLPGNPLAHGQPNKQGFAGADAPRDRDAEIEAITENLAKRVSEQLDMADLAMSAGPFGGTPNGGNAQRGAPGAGLQGRGGSSHWSMGDLLARASEDDNQADDEGPMPLTAGADAHPGNANAGFGNQAGLSQTAPPININAIAQLVDQAAAVELWRNYRSGLRTPISESVYNDRGEAFRRIAGLYGSDYAFRGNVDRYITDFDRLLNESEAKDPAGNLSTKHLTSDSGRVYLLLMHAAGRIGG